MANNYDEYDDYDETEEESGSSSSLLKKIGIALLIIIAIIIVLLLIKGCSGKSGNKKNSKEFEYESALLEGGKTYFQNNQIELPKVVGECTTVSLQDLIEKGLVETTKFEKCNSVTSEVRACMLENTTIQYTPWLTCNDKVSEDEYSPAVEGTVHDVIADQSAVEFLFLPQVLTKGEDSLGEVEEVWKDDITYVSYKTLATNTYYRYRDELYKWKVVRKVYYTKNGEKTDANDVKEYYTSSPSSKYNESDNKTTEAYKWFTTTSTKEYALAENGGKKFSATPIGDYNMNEGGVVRTMYQTRTVTGSHAPTKYYLCTTDASGRYAVTQTVNCPSDHNPDYKYLKEVFYSCADPSSTSQSVLGQKVDQNQTCKTYSAWKTTSEACDTSNSELCRSVSVTFYNWYKLVDSGDRTYYPSGASTAAGENTYYTKAPVEGAIKDAATKSTAYKWYYTESTTTKNYTAVAPSGYVSTEKTSDKKWGDWSKWSKSNPKINDGRNRQIESKVKIKLQEIKGSTSGDWEDLDDDYLSEEALIKVYQNKGYKVATLEDINNNGDIRYQVKMLVRNKKEGY